MENPGSWKTFQIVFTVAGLALLAIGVISIPGTISFVNRSVVTQGTVVGVESEFAGEGNVYLPTVRFITQDGQSIVFTSSTGEDAYLSRIGESVTVRYVPADPTDARIDSFLQLWGGLIIPAVIGGVFILWPGGMYNRLRDTSPGSPEPDADRNGESGLRPNA